MYNKLLKLFNFKLFLISFSIGVLYIYLTEDYKKVIILYPTPDNVDKYVYVDKSNNCFNFDLQWWSVLALMKLMLMLSRG
jgi:hypothetical protein